MYFFYFIENCLIVLNCKFILYVLKFIIFELIVYDESEEKNVVIWYFKIW